MVNPDDIERVISGSVKKAIVKYIRENPDAYARKVYLAVWGEERDWPANHSLTVHISQSNRVLRVHGYQIKNGYLQRRAPKYRLVSLKGT